MSINDRILINVGTYLDARSFTRMETVCCGWHRILTKNDSWRKFLTTHFPHFMTTSKAKKNFKNLFRLLFTQAKGMEKEMKALQARSSKTEMEKLDAEILDARDRIGQAMNQIQELEHIPATLSAYENRLVNLKNKQKTLLRYPERIRELAGQLRSLATVDLRDFEEQLYRQAEAAARAASRLNTQNGQKERCCVM